jgi:tetratricopeptide (TPR) repeat protein
MGRSVAQSTGPMTTAKTYELTLPKPLELKFARGNDGGAYCVFVPTDPKYDAVEIGDKILAVSASFGNEIWTADSYGQVMYAIKNRNGDIYLKLQSNGGDTSALEANEKSSAFKNERNGGNYGAGTKEQQMNNYSKKRELETQRLDMFDEAIELYNGKDYDSALIIFEEVAALEPKNYMGDDFAKTTEIYKVAQYNIACCFSRIGKEDESILALRRCLTSGWSDYKKMRTDPSLEFVRNAGSGKFTDLLDKFDEPIINANAVKAFKSLFKFGGDK